MGGAQRLFACVLLSWTNPIPFMHQKRINHLGRLIALILTIGSLVFISATAKAKPFELTHDMSATAPLANAQVMEDAGRKLNPKEIVAGSHDGLFMPISGGRTSMGITRSAWWVKFEARNSTTEPISWVFNMTYPLTDIVDIYHILDGKPNGVYELGDKRPYDDRMLPGEAFAAPLVTLPGQTSVVYARTVNRLGDGIDLYFEVSSPKVYAAKQNVISGFIGLFIGGSLLILFYNLIVYLVLRTRVYLWYVIYLSSALFTFITVSGAGNRLIWTHETLLSEAMPPLISSAAGILVVQFSRVFLETHIHVPRIDRVLIGAMGILVLPPLIFFAGDAVLAAHVVMGSLLLLVGLPILGGWMWWNGHRVARTFTLAWGVWFFAIIVLIGRFLGWIPTNDYTLRVAWLGILGEALLFALALADRIRILQSDKEAAEKGERTALMRSKEELENLVSARTTELEHQRDALRQSNLEKDKFFSIIAHDLRGPFNGFIGLSEVLKLQLHKMQKPAIAEYIQDLNKSATNLYKLLENLLSWSMLQQGQIKFAPETFDLAELVASNIELFEPMAAQKQLEISSNCPTQVLLDADRQMLDTVLRNLLNNAVKFSHTGGHIRLDIKAFKDNVELIVTDTGVGISENIKNRLFVLSEKASTMGTGGELGSGLGLQLCGELVGLHGGQISAESKIGEGARFRVVIPRTVDKELIQ